MLDYGEKISERVSLAMSEDRLEWIYSGVELYSRGIGETIFVMFTGRGRYVRVA